MTPKLVVAVWEINDDLACSCKLHFADSSHHRIIPEYERGVSTVELHVESTRLVQACVRYIEVTLISEIRLFRAE